MINNNNNNNNNHQLDQPVITPITSSPPHPPFRKLLFFACFRFLIFHPFFQRVSWPHLPICADGQVSDSCCWNVQRLKAWVPARLCGRSIHHEEGGSADDMSVVRCEHGTWIPQLHAYSALLSTTYEYIGWQWRNLFSYLCPPLSPPSCR